MKKIGGDKEKEAGKRWRGLLRSIAKTKLSGRDQKTLLKGISDKTGIPQSTLNQILYRDTGSIDKWGLFLEELFDMTPEQMLAITSEIKRKLRKDRKLTKGEMLLEKIIDDLPEDKRIFWAEVINFTEGLDPSFSIQRQKRKKDIN